MDKLLEIMARLRDPNGGCPWDLEQTFATIAPYTLEEAFEVADAIERNDLDDLRDELGDLLLQVVFHSQMAEEAGAFSFADVHDGICAKMIRRHPHVFGDARVGSAAEQTASWEAIKAAEKAAAGNQQAESALDNVPLNLPALTRAAKLGKKAARVGFDWPDKDGVLAKIREEVAEVSEAQDTGDAAGVEEEIGDLLFAVCNLARHHGVDPEQALRRGNQKFTGRFQALEASLAGEGKAPVDCSLDELEAVWQRVKAGPSATS